MNKIFASSVDPNELSLTIKGFLVAAVPVVMLIVRAAGAEIQQEEISAFVQTLADIVGALGALIAMVLVGVGMFRKLYAELTREKES